MKRVFKKIWKWIDDRTGLSEVVLPLLKHPVPPNYLWSYVFGSATLFCFVLQVITGVALSLSYQPSSETAYQSLQFITHQAKFGNLLRSIHYYGASAMIILIGLHMMRTYIVAAYKYPREMSWITGVVLLICTIFMGFTGQLLRWDSNGVWSSVVAAEQLGRVPFVGTYLARLLIGGNTLGGHTLGRFYSYHVFIVPAAIFLLAGFHIYLVFKNGISEPPEPGRLVDPKTYRAWYADYLKEKAIPFWPNAIWRDLMFTSIIIIALVIGAIIVGAPKLTTPPDPAAINTSPKPDWYMVPFFALFALMPHKMESIAMMLGPLLTIMLLLALPFISNKGERSPIRRPWAIFGVICVFVFVLSLVIIGRRAPWSPDFDATPLPVTAIKAVNPDSSILAGVHLFYTKGCEYCHTIHKFGGRNGPDLTAIGNRLSEQEITIRIVNGGGNMPAFGGLLTKDELDKLTGFLETQK
jgi:ubiquinol-cytochrome c reductase cytochrome b subunit